MIDFSASILYDQQKEHSEFLELVNACVSHELRNPLNSIVAQNTLNNFLYQELKEVVGLCRLKKCDNTIIVKRLAPVLIDLA